MGSYLAHGPKIYPKAHENPRALSCIFDSIFLESSIQCPLRVGLHKNAYRKARARKIGEKSVHDKIVTKMKIWDNILFVVCLGKWIQISLLVFALRIRNQQKEMTIFLFSIFNIWPMERGFIWWWNSYEKEWTSNSHTLCLN